MSLKQINEFQVVDTIEESDKTPKVVLENKNLKKKIQVLGQVLERQYRVGERFLVLLTEGNPFEEALYIYFFSKNLQVIDALELSAMYSEGILNNVSVSNSDEIRFSFFYRDDQWALKIFSCPKYKLFSNKYPVKRHLSIFNKNWLSLKKVNKS